MSEFTIQQLIGISLILLVLGAILGVHMHERRYAKPLTSADAEAIVDPMLTTKGSWEDRHVVDFTGDRKPTG